MKLSETSTSSKTRGRDQEVGGVMTQKILNDCSSYLGPSPAALGTSMSSKTSLRLDIRNPVMTQPVRVRTSKRSYLESFMKNGPQEACTPSLFLESWRMWSFLTHLVMFSDGREYPREASLKSLAGVLTWRVLTHLVMVSDGSKHPREASLKVS